MENLENYLNRGATIKPSARRSIRSDCSSLADSQNMGRFGLKTKSIRKDAAGSSLEQGTDEVDNVMSKFSPPRYPLSSELKIQRRNSLNSPSDLYTEEEGNDDDDDVDDSDDSDDKVLSKSLPANFSSNSHCRDIPTSRQRDQHRSNSSIRSYASQSYTRINDSSGSSHFESNFSNTQERDKVQKKTNYKLILTVLVVVLGIIYSSCKNVINTSTVINFINYDKNDFFNDMNDLREKYRINDDSVLRVKSGISSIFERSDASSFIFVYNSQSNNFNPSQFNKFMDEVSYTAAKYLRNDSTSVSFIMIDGSKLDMKTHGELISKYRDEITKTGVMLIKDIDTVPSALAMAFHYYCDEYDPLAKKTAIFFTLNVARCSYSSVQKSSHDIIEKCLAKKWNGIPRDNIGPLLTRVVNIVVDVTSVF